MEDFMAQQTFSVGGNPRVTITQVHGDFQVRTWDERSISVETDGTVADLQQEGDLLTILDCDDDLVLIVPSDTAIQASNVNGDAVLEGVRRVVLENVSGDAVLKNISGDAGVENIGEAVELTTLGGDLVVMNAPVLHVRHAVGGDAQVKQVGVVEIETIGGDFSMEQGETVVVSTVGGDISVRGVQAALRCGVIGGDASVQASPNTEVTLGTIGGDLSLNSAENVQVGHVGGDCSIRGIQGDIELGHVGGDIKLEGVNGHLQIGRIASDASLRGLQGGVEVGAVGGDLVLHSLFLADTRSRLNIGGDAVVVVQDDANLNIVARVGGDISGRSIVASRSGKMINLVYGSGAAHLELNVGGDLALKGPGNPRSSSSSDSSSGTSGSWNDFGHDMSNLGGELSRLGQDLSREIASAFSEAGWSSGAGIAEEIARKAEDAARRAQRQAEKQGRRAGEQGRRAGEQASRINIRLNEREWRLDPERLERIREHARRAAAEGVSGALEAVERAVSNLHIPTPSKPPVSPVPPVKPVSPVPPVPPIPPNFSESSDSREDVPAHSTEQQEQPPAASYDIEQEREAILRMIAEGRVTPEEGDLLLEALGS